MSTKTQSSIDLFVFNCIRNSSNNHISSVNSKDTSSIQVSGLVLIACSHLLVQYKNLMLICLACSISHTQLARLRIFFVQLVIEYLNKLFIMRTGMRREDCLPDTIDDIVLNGNSQEISRSVSKKGCLCFIN